MADPKKQFVSRELTGEVRKLALQQIRKILLGEDSDIKNQVILRLAGQILPRLSETTGEDGGPIIIQVAKEGAEKYGLNSTSGPSDNPIGQTQV